MTKNHTKQKSPQLPVRHYYNLEQAATYLRRQGAESDIDAEYLLHLGATGRIGLAVVCRTDWAFTTQLRYFGKNAAEMMLDPELRRYTFTPKKPVCLTPTACLDIELEGLHQTSITEYWYMTDDVDDESTQNDTFSALWFDGDGKKPVCYWLDAKADGTPPVITAKMLVVTHENLQHLLGGKKASGIISVPAQPSIPHGNAERFAVNREAVLKAAIACKEKFKDQCTDAEKWATCIEQQASHWWPDAGQPPLEHSVIVKLLQEAVKLPQVTAQ